MGAIADAYHLLESRQSQTNTNSRGPVRFTVITVYIGEHHLSVTMQALSRQIELEQERADAAKIKGQSEKESMHRARENEMRAAHRVLAEARRTAANRETIEVPL